MAFLTKDRSAFAERRYWGDRTPPSSKAEFFAAVTQPAPSGDGTTATIRIFGPIDSWGGYWGVSAQDVTDVLDRLGPEVTQIIVRLNSPGGEVFEGLAILNALRAHKATTTGVVDGIAASAASVILAGLDEAVMSPGGMVMIHSPWVCSCGSAEELRKDAQVLDTIQSSMVEVYAAKAGEKDWPALLSEETWLAASEAVTFGIADRVAVVPDAGVAVEDEPDTVVITIGEDGVEIADRSALAPAARAGKPSGTEWLRKQAAASTVTQTPAAPAAGETGKEAVMTTAAPETEVEPVETDAPTEVDETPEAADTAAAPGETTAIDGAAQTAADGARPETESSEAADGTVVLDKAAFEELQRQAAIGREAVAAERPAQIKSILDKAIKAGKFPETRRAHHEASLKADFEGHSALIERMASLTTEVGFDADAEIVATDDDSDFEAAHQRTLAARGIHTTKGA